MKKMKRIMKNRESKYAIIVQANAVVPVQVGVGEASWVLHNDLDYII